VEEWHIPGKIARPSLVLVLQAADAGVRRPGYEANWE